jgi:hypothetical protein
MIRAHAEVYSLRVQPNDESLMRHIGIFVQSEKVVSHARLVISYRCN